MKLNTSKVKGVLKLSKSEENYDLVRILPKGKLAFFIEQYWIVRWELETPHIQENIPHPSVHLVFEKNNSRIVGPVTKKYSYTLADAGTICGVKFRPGAFYPFFNNPVSEIADRTISLTDIFGSDVKRLEMAVLSRKSGKNMVVAIEDFLLPRLPVCDEHPINSVNDIIDKIESDRSITRVDDIVDQFKINKRTLQRLFKTYVGVSPKWIIRKYRLHEVLDKFEAGSIDYHQIIHDLGYFDQAHFIKDFKEIIGVSPLKYLNDGAGT